MALGEIAKQLAGQAISETLRTGKPTAQAQADNRGAAIVGQVQAMQKALKEDEELVVLFTAGAQTVRVLEIYVPSWQVIVLKGIDADKNTTRVISPVESLQLICKVMKVAPPAKPNRVGFITPKP